MSRPHTTVVPLRSLLLAFFALCLGAVPASAQSVAAVVDEMQARHTEQLQTVDTYVVETNLYTSYNKKITQNGAPTYQTTTQMTGNPPTSFASSTTPSAAYGLQLDRLKQHARYEGTETVNGTRCHILQVDDPSKVNPNLQASDATSMTYYIDAERYVPSRIRMKPRSDGARGPQTSSVTINMVDYRTIDGLTRPHRMEFHIETSMSEQQRQQMQQAMKQMENMPEQRRKQMESMMGNQMEMMKRMMSGEPIVVEVQRVEVNTELPEGVFSN